MLKRTYGAGIFLFGGKPSGSRRRRAARALPRPPQQGRPDAAGRQRLGRHRDLAGRARSTTTTTSPADPNGYWNWAAQPKHATAPALGFAFYHDGGHKNYDFNNILWGLNNDTGSKLCNRSAWNEATPTVHNNFFNNTIYRFAMGSNWSPSGGFHSFLGNIWDDISEDVFIHGRLKEDIAPAPANGYPTVPDGLRQQRLLRHHRTLGVFESSGPRLQDPPVLQGGPRAQQGARRGPGHETSKAAAARPGQLGHAPGARLGRHRRGRQVLRPLGPLRHGRRVELLPRGQRRHPDTRRALVHADYYRGRGLRLASPPTR